MWHVGETGEVLTGFWWGNLKRETTWKMKAKIGGYN
jgi:hypothetical protein